jgi:hypothetical protein
MVATRLVFKKITRDIAIIPVNFSAEASISNNSNKRWMNTTHPFKNFRTGLLVLDQFRMNML